VAVALWLWLLADLQCLSTALDSRRSHKGADSQNHGCTVGMHSELLLQICTDRFSAESVSVAYSRDFGSARSPCHGLGGSNLLISYQRLSLPIRLRRGVDF
jgi:hypothetical protein